MAISPYTTAVPGNGRDFGPRAAARCACLWPGMEEDFAHVPALRTDGQGPPGGPQGEPPNIKTKRRFLPNLVNVTFISDALARNVRLRVSTNALKSVDHNGGLDSYLLKTKSRRALPRALDLKRAIEKKVGKPVFVKKAS